MRNVSRILPLLPGIAMLSGCNNAAQKSNGQNDQKPNIIYIFADDLGIGDLSCYGATKVSTPNIDRLAGQGVQFTNAYATSATSTPSRFGLLTGMYPWRQKNTGIAPGNYLPHCYISYSINKSCRHHHKTEDRKSTRLNSSHKTESRMPSSA